ncbi:MAG: hypothetical protein R3346_02855 [Candidatus Spechtbacterales bacterium]|nr:hypothetical protein [Candidatus Spechtbacterales bacterium]
MLLSPSVKLAERQSCTLLDTEIERETLTGLSFKERSAIHKMLDEEEICHWHNNGKFHYFCDAEEGAQDG